MKRFLLPLCLSIVGCNENKHVSGEVNNAPTIKALSTINIAAGKSTTIDVIASDKDGDRLTYSLVNNPDWASIQDNIISIAPSHADIGQYVLTVKVSDGSLSAEMNTALNVNLPMTPVNPDDVNHAPTIEALPTINIAAGKSTTVDVVASDKDGDTLTYSLVNNPDWVSIQDNIISIAPSHVDIGQYVLKVKVSDGSLSAEMNTALNVNLPMTPVNPDVVNHAPTIAALPTIKISAGKSTTVDVVASDKDGDTLTYSLVNNPDWVTIQDNTISIAPSHADAGQHVLKVKVSDGIFDTETELNIIGLGVELDSPALTETNFRTADYILLGEDIPVITVGLDNVKTLGFNHSFSFNNISFFNNNGLMTIENNTPTNISKMIIKYGENEIALLEMPYPLNAMSSAELYLPAEIVDAGNIRASYQTRAYLPNVSVGLTSTDDESEAFNPAHVTCGSDGRVCHRPAFGLEREILTTMAINIHNLMNTRDVIFRQRNFINSKCDDYDECVAYDNTRHLPYSEFVRNMNGYEGHSMYLQLHTKNKSGIHTSEGYGSGSFGNLNNFYSEEDGWASVKDVYVNKDSEQYRPYSASLYNTFFHEGAHASGLSHESGMSYGFADDLMVYMIEKDLVLPEHTVENINMWAGTRKEYIVPDIYLDVAVNDSFGAVIKVMKTNDIEIGDLTFELSSHTPVSYVFNQIDSNTFFIQFDETFPDIAADNKDDFASRGTTFFIQAYRKNAPDAKVVSYKIDRRMLIEQRERSSKITYNSMYEYFVLENDEFSSSDTPFDMRMRCFNLYGKLASPEQYSKIYDYLKKNNALSTLEYRSFISNAEDNGYIVSDFLDDEHKNDRRVIYWKPIGEDMSGICVLPRQQ